MLSYDKLSNRDINRAGTQETNIGITSELEPSDKEGCAFTALVKNIEYYP